ncbi:hypothetical protein DRE_04894 [Drechslerella stenobrocha 248]|uniref:Putative lipoate-protein ligase A n=1 Tax=Drechslerella stenobrocha 248 TaxID=1043628 RepID=W7I081_9PEZI|nr:hypothetical protein DRE_04894 [Drechslerella stenobrocha 248]
MPPPRGRLLSDCSLAASPFRLHRRRLATLPASSVNSARRPAPHDAPPITQLRLSPARLHIYRSSSTDPFFNLSAEDYLLRHSPSDSTILFTYTNAPSIVIGRNQNPWAEVNMPLLLQQQERQKESADDETSAVRLVRRRSGGGTVYHDLGNLCWSVIMPRKEFDRDVNAHMVVRALRKLGVASAAVNERHDIVLRGAGGDKKVSGSAYKIVRERAYHHATLLLDSHLAALGSLLDSPLRPFLQTQGVASVRSSVANIGVRKETLVDAIEAEFLTRNDAKDGEVSRVTLGQETAQERDYIREGMEELQSSKWLYNQTPRCTLTIPPETRLPELPGLPNVTPILPEHARFSLMVERGRVVHASVTTSPDPDFAFVQSQDAHGCLLNKPFAGPDLADGIAQTQSLDKSVMGAITNWLEHAVGAWGGGEWDRNTTTDGNLTMRERSRRRVDKRIAQAKTAKDEGTETEETSPSTTNTK